MFSILSSETQTRIPITVAIVLAALLLAFALSVMAAFQVLEEYRMLGDVARPVRARVDCRALGLEARHRDADHRQVDRLGRTAALHGGDALAPATPARRSPDFASSQAACPQYPLEPESGGHHHGPAVDHHEHQLRGDRPDRRRRRVHRPAHRIDFHPGDAARGTLPRRSREHREPSATASCLDRAGRVHHLVASAHELKDMRGATIGCVIHLRDVTERILMKEQMWRMEQFASLSTLASGLLHEIKNPMTALSIHVQLLEERLSGDSADEQIARDDRGPQDRGPPAQRYAVQLP